MCAYVEVVCVCVYMYATRCTQSVWCEKGVCECSMCVSIVYMEYRVVEFSVPTRHQLLQCYLHTDKTTIQGSKFVVGPGKYYACCGMICMLCSSVLHGVMILWMRVIPPP